MLYRRQFAVAMAGLVMTLAGCGERKLLSEDKSSPTTSARGAGIVVPAAPATPAETTPSALLGTPVRPALATPTIAALRTATTPFISPTIIASATPGLAVSASQPQFSVMCPPKLIFHGMLYGGTRDCKDLHGPVEHVERGDIIGHTAARWQSAMWFPAGTPIYSVVGRPPKEAIAVEIFDRTIVLEAGHADPLGLVLPGVQVVVGNVTAIGTARLGDTPYDLPFTVAIQEVWHGLLISVGETVEVIEFYHRTDANDSFDYGEFPAPMKAGDRVILFIMATPESPKGSYRPSPATRMVQPHGIYRIDGDLVNPIGVPGDPAPLISLADCRANVAEIFKGAVVINPQGTPTTQP